VYANAYPGSTVRVRETHRISRMSSKSYPYQPTIDKKSRLMKAIKHLMLSFLGDKTHTLSIRIPMLHPTSGIFNHAKTRTRARDGTGMSRACFRVTSFLPPTSQRFGIPALAATFKVTMCFMNSLTVKNRYHKILDTLKVNEGKKKVRDKRT